MKSISYHPMVSSIILSSIACGLTVFLFWTCPRGFDIWDEGLYLITSLHPNDVGSFASSYYYYTGFLFFLSDYNIAAFRASGIILLLIAVAFLASGIRAINRAHPDRSLSSANIPELLPFLVIGAFVYYGSFALSTPSYNLLNSVLLTSIVGMAFHGFAGAKSGFENRTLKWFLFAGILTGIDALIKLPSAILIGNVIVIAGWFWSGVSPRIRHRLLAAYLFGGIVWLLIHFTLIEDFFAFAEKIRISRKYEADLGIALTFHDIIRYFLEITQITWTTLTKTWPAIVIMCILLTFFTVVRTDQRFLLPLCWLTTFAIVGIHLKEKYHLGGYTKSDNARQMMEFYLSWAIILFISLAVLATIQRLRTKQKASIPIINIIIPSMLAAIPLIGTIGTHNFVGYNLLLTLAPWFALLLYFASRIESYGLPLRIPVQLAIALFAATQLLSAYRTAQYHAKRGVFEQNTPTTLGDPETQLLLDQETRNAIEAIRLQAKSCGFQRGDVILGFYEVPGLVFALGGRTPPGISFFTGTWTSGALPVKAQENLLGTIPYDKIHDAFVLESLKLGELVPNLHKFGRDFPDEYQFCGETLWPASQRMIKLWKPILDVPKNSS